MKALQLTSPFTYLEDCFTLSMSESRNINQNSIVGKGLDKFDSNDSSEISSSLDDKSSKISLENCVTSRPPSLAFDENGDRRNLADLGYCVGYLEIFESAFANLC